MLKKTEYFMGYTPDSVSINQHNKKLDSCIEDAKKKRDEFIEKSRDNIGKIDSEVIQIIVSGNGNIVQAIITLTYYPKK